MSTGFPAGSIFAEMTLTAKEFFLELSRAKNQAQSNAKQIQGFFDGIGLRVVQPKDFADDQQRIAEINQLAARSRREQIVGSRQLRRAFFEEAIAAKQSAEAQETLAIAGQRRFVGLAATIRGNSSAFQNLSFGVQDAIQGFSQFGATTQGLRFAMLGATNNIQLFLQQIGIAKSAVAGFGIGLGAALIPLIVQLGISALEAKDRIKETREELMSFLEELKDRVERANETVLRLRFGLGVHKTEGLSNEESKALQTREAKIKELMELEFEAQQAIAKLEKKRQEEVAKATHEDQRNAINDVANQEKEKLKRDANIFKERRRQIEELDIEESKKQLEKFKDENRRTGFRGESVKKLEEDIAGAEAKRRLEQIEADKEAKKKAEEAAKLEERKQAAIRRGQIFVNSGFNRERVAAMQRAESLKKELSDLGILTDKRRKMIDDALQEELDAIDQREKKEEVAARSRELRERLRQIRFAIRKQAALGGGQGTRFIGGPESIIRSLQQKTPELDYLKRIALATEEQLLRNEGVVN